MCPIGEQGNLICLIQKLTAIYYFNSLQGSANVALSSESVYRLAGVEQKKANACQRFNLSVQFPVNYVPASWLDTDGKISLLRDT